MVRVDMMHFSFRLVAEDALEMEVNVCMMRWWEMRGEQEQG